MGFLLAHWGDIILVFTNIVSVLGATKWGHSNKQALDAVTRAVELANAVTVKRSVEKQSNDLGGMASRALDKSVAKAEKDAK